MCTMGPIDIKSHPKELLKMLNQQRIEQASFCDLSLMSKCGQSFPAHSCVLAACSGYFESLLKQHKPGSILVLKDYTSDALEVFIKLMYTGQFELPVSLLSVDKVRYLKHLAELLQIKAAARLCEDYIEGNSYWGAVQDQSTQCSIDTDMNMQNDGALTTLGAACTNILQATSQFLSKKVSSPKSQTVDEGNQPDASGSEEEDEITSDPDFYPGPSEKSRIGSDDEDRSQDTTRSSRYPARKRKRTYKMKNSTTKRFKKHKKTDQKNLEGEESGPDESIYVETNTRLVTDQDQIDESFNYIVQQLATYKRQPVRVKEGNQASKTVQDLEELLGIREENDTHNSGDCAGENESQDTQEKCVTESLTTAVTPVGRLRARKHRFNTNASNEIETETSQDEFNSTLHDSQIDPEVADSVNRTFEKIQLLLSCSEYQPVSNASKSLEEALQPKVKPDSQEEENEWKNCQYCKQFKGKKKGRFEFHNRYCHSEFKCEQCFKPFLNTFDLSKHQCFKVKKPVICELCGKCLSTQNGLVLHKRVHAGIKHHQCSLCGKMFHRKVQLNAHKIHVHSKERPFKCDICQKAYGLKYELNRHMISHNEVHSNLCNICGMGFHERHKLLKHIDSVHKNENTENEGRVVVASQTRSPLLQENLMPLSSGTETINTDSLMLIPNSAQDIENFVNSASDYEMSMMYYDPGTGQYVHSTPIRPQIDN